MPRKIQGRSWLDAYLEYVEDTSSPPQFKLWSGISTIGSTLKRRVYVKRAKTTVFPNQYIVLVAPPGIGKGEAVRPAVAITKEANTANFIEDRATAERIQEILANGFHVANNNGAVPSSGLIMGMEHSATALAEELSVFLGASDWTLPFLCNLWDKSEFTYDTKKTKTVVVKNNCFSLLASCTPDYIRRINKDSMAAISSGFTARTIFVFANKSGKIEAFPPDVPHHLHADLVEDLRNIAQLSGEFTWEDSAKLVATDFINKNVIDTDINFESEVLLNFRSRMWSHVFKNSMILSVSEGDDLVIKEQNIKDAIKNVTEVFKNLDITFRGVGESDLAEATAIVMSFIEKKGVASRSEILHKNWRHVTDEDLTRILFTLKSIGFCFESNRGNTYIYTHNKQFEG